MDIRSNLKINVLGYEEDGRWIAHALEMDLVGTGDSPEAALEVLRGLAVEQIRFAIDAEDPSMIFFDAPPELWQKFQEARRSLMASVLPNPPGAKRPHSKYRAFDIPFPPEQIRVA